MAPSGRATRPGRAPAPVQRKGNTNANAVAGFAKRQARKATATAKGPALSDVYEFQQAKQRRSRVSVDTRLGREEAAEFGFGHGEENEEDGARQEMRARLIGENDDDEGLGSDEDEEIDSDVAFEEEDEDRYAGFNFSSSKKAMPLASKKASSSRKTKPSASTPVDVNLDEESDDAAASDMDQDRAPASGVGEVEEEEEEEEEGMVDLLDILDGKAKPYFASDSGDEDSGELIKGEPPGNISPQVGPSLQNASDEDSEEGSGSDEDEDEDDDADMLSVSDDDAPVAEEALDDLSNFISGLDASSKRKADAIEQPAVAARPPKRRVIKEVSEGVPENEFAARMPTGSQKLNLEDLLAPLATRPSSELQALKKSTKMLSSSKKGTLSAPLPTRAQERLDREAAYEQTKEEVDKWSATMKRIKEAEHLSFPLQQERPSQTSNLELNAKFKPTTELETAVDRLLKTARLREQDMQQTEDLKMNHLTPEEAQARRAELRKMRELMFRAETKAKRVAKIKSKSYRRIKKKERAKLAEKLGDTVADDPDDEEARLRREVERARERATLRHKNTGKWAKSMHSRGEMDEEQRENMNDMLDRGEKLRRRIQGVGSGEEESEDDDMDSDADPEALKAGAFNELQALRREEDVDPADGASKKSVFKMKFMQDAMKRDMHRVDRSIDDFVNEMGGQLSGEERGTSEPPTQNADEPTVERAGGRVSFRPGQMAGTAGLRPLSSMESNSSSATLKSTDGTPVSPTAPRRDQPPLRVTPPPGNASPSTPAANPWLKARDDTNSSRAIKRHEVVVSKNSSAPDKSKHKLRKQVLKTKGEQEKARADADLEISVDQVLVPTAASSTSAPAKGKGKARKQSVPGAADDDDDQGSEVEFQEQTMQHKGKKGAFQQRDLVAAAFADDNVVQDFAQAKQREIQEDAPREIDMSLAGWGSWGGKGTQKQAPKPFLIKKVAGIDPKSRADYGKAHVIISEKRDKKAAKYLVKDLPYPYTSKEQFERSLSTPLGTEWNTRVGFQRGTLPKLVMKPGTIINPLEKLA